LPPPCPILARLNGAWAFPCDLAPVKELPCDMVFTFLLEVPRGAPNALIINGVECIGLAHGACVWREQEGGGEGLP
jgi:hypothetical protein